MRIESSPDPTNHRFIMRSDEPLSRGRAGIGGASQNFTEWTNVSRTLQNKLVTRSLDGRASGNL